MTIYTDAGTSKLSLTPSSTDVDADVDLGTASVLLTPSAIEGHSTYDSGTVRLTLAPSGLEHTLPYDPELRITANGLVWSVKGTQRFTLTPEKWWFISAVTK